MTDEFSISEHHRLTSKTARTLAGRRHVPARLHDHHGEHPERRDIDD